MYIVIFFVYIPPNRSMFILLGFALLLQH